MLWISLDFRWPAFVTPHEDRRRCAKQRRRRRVEKRLAGNVFFRLFDVGNDLLRWLKNAPAQPRQRQRRAHQLHERAALDRVVPPFSLLRKLTLNKLTKQRRVSQFVEAAPVFLPAARRLGIL